jgi:uncharacterized protein (DUF1697 family)
VKTRYVALMRGINVGGKNMLPMKELAAMFAAAGGSDVSTYIQSGNVLFSADDAVAAKLPDAVRKKIAARFGFEIPIVVRSQREWAKVASAHPFAGDGVDLSILAVMFLADKPTARSIAALDAQRSPPDVFLVRGREIFVRCPTGFAKTKLTNAWFDGKLATVSTARNWRTVQKLDELLKS